MVAKKCFPVFLIASLTSAAAGAQLTITTSNVPVATQYQSYTATLSATGGTPPYVWSVVQSTNVSLPEGMTLNPATGVVSASQVNGQGGYEVTIQVTDSASPSHNVATAAIDFGVYSDTGLGGCQVFPVDSIYNQRVDRLPVDTTPSHQIPSGSLGSPLHPDFGHGFYPFPGGIPWMRVPANQPDTNVYIGGGQIDDAGTYSWPFPAGTNALIEGTSYGADGSDHHTLILQSSVNNITGPQTGPCTLYETYQSNAVPTLFDTGSNTWTMGAGLHYVLNSDELATSDSTLDQGAQDSAGIPVMPLLLRYSDVPLLAQHPLRITFAGSTNWFAWPATGCCSGSGPPQGLLYRLKASVNWAATCPVATYPQAATLLQTLQQYGAYMSDHGSNGYIQGVPDIRWNDDDLACIKKFHLSDLEVVDNSVLEVSDTSGQTKPYVSPAALAGGTAGNFYSATFSAVGGNPQSLTWTVSSGALPAGLVLNASQGSISGLLSPTATGTFSFGMSATDTSTGYSSASQRFSIAVIPFIVTIQGGSPPPPVAITVTSMPAGLQVTVDGSTYLTPQKFTWAQGSSHLLSTISAQGSGTRYVFANWSDGGAISHAIAVPGSAANYTASFTTQYLLARLATPAGFGSIVANPNSADGYYNSGAQVQVSAVPAAGQTFGSFSGDLSGPANPQTLTMSAARAVTANFGGTPRLAATLARNGDFARGSGSAMYLIAVRNAGSGPTTGTVSVNEMLPPGVMLLAMAGPGWTCISAERICTRGDSLASESSYPPLNVIVNIAANAPALLMNAVTVSGGGAPPATATLSVAVSH